ncbi:DNA primase [Streptomyces eurythermus]|uniref:DNA primase n=1 Tax=Streptomyces eurythermus TaxID=42237 RepID=UPI0033FEE061
MNRTALGLAVGAGYLLGRTKKLKMALAVGSLVAGKKLNLSPKTLADLVNQQLKSNPQFQEIGDQLRQDLRGVGKAATGAMVERRMSSLADRLHSRTDQVRDQLSGGSGEEAAEGEEGPDKGSAEKEEAPEKGSAEEEGASEKGSAERKAPQKKAPGRKPAKKPLSSAGKGATRKTGAAGKAAAKRTAGAGQAARGAAGRHSKGGDDR